MRLGLTATIITSALALAAGGGGAEAGSPTGGRVLADAGLLPPAARTYALSGPVIHPAERRSAMLEVADINGDGAQDFLTVANDKSVIELFLADAKEERKFRKETVSVDTAIQSIGAVDVDGDGRMDLVLTTSGGRVEVMYQSKEGRLQSAQETALRATDLRVADVNGDKRDDVVLYRKGVIQILLAKTRGIELTPAQTMYTAFEATGAPAAGDLDGDGKPDLLFQDNGQRDMLVVRLQSPEGTFPSEFRLTPGEMRDMSMVSAPGVRVQIAGIQNKTRQLILFQLADARKDSKGTAPVELSDLHTVAFDPDTTSDRVDSVVADVDGDGRPDVVVTSPKVPALRVLQQGRTGSLTVRMAPSLEGIESLTPLPSKPGEPAPLLVYSGKEKAAGIVEGRKGAADLPLPRLLPELGAPSATALITLGGKPHVVFARDAEGGGSKIAAFEIVGSGLGKEQPVTGAASDAKSRYTSLATMDLNADGRGDLAAFGDFKTPALFLQDDKGALATVTVKGGLLEGLLDGLRAGQLMPVQLDGMQKPAVLAVKSGFGRVFTLDAKGDVTVTEQFNARNTRARFAAAAVGNFREKARRDVAFLDTGNKTVTFFGVRAEGGRYEELITADLDGADYRTMEVLDLDGDGRDDLLLVAPDRVSILYTRKLNAGFETVASAETAVEDGGYLGVYAMDLIPGGAEELVTVEGRENLLEFFTVGKGADDKPALLRFYSFKCFDSEGSLAQRVNLDGSPEPREMLTVTVGEGGLPSIVALTHDLILRYDAGERKAPKDEKKP